MKTFLSPAIPSLTPIQILEVLERSGYLMEHRICPLIWSHGYIVTPNHEYEDQDTGKSREIDVHAITVDPIGFRKSFDDLFSTILLISCKNNHLPIVAFMHNNYMKGISIGNPVPKAGYPLEIEKPNSIIEDIEEFLKLENVHHYYRPRYIASQYCRITGQKQGKTTHYIADHGDLYNDLDSLVKAVESEVADYKKLPEKQAEELEPVAKESAINFVLIYPVMIFSGEMYECHTTKSGPKLRPVNHLVFMRRVQSRTIKGEFFVDFVREAYLNRYLNTLDRERKEIAQRLRRKRKTLREEVARQLHELTSSQKSA
jgi:hypothetical protein